MHVCRYVERYEIVCVHRYVESCVCEMVVCVYVGVWRGVCEMERCACRCVERCV